MELYSVEQQRAIVDHLELAADVRSRTRGLIGHPSLSPGQGLMIHPCRWIHTFGMSFPIDVIYVGREWRIVALSENLRPRRVDRPVLRAHFAVEMAAGAIHRMGLRVGEHVELRT